MKIKERVMLPGSKWSKHQILEGSEEIRDYLPHTELYSERTLRSFLKQYSTVFIKPTRGFGGLNIFRVEQGQDDEYVVTMQNIRKTLTSTRAIHEWVLERGRQQDKKKFLIQNGIDLAQCYNRPVDIRVVVQRNESNRWEVSGQSAKVAGDQLAVTNVARGGHAMEVAVCLEEIGFSTEETEELIAEMNQLALQVARYLGKSYSNTIYGFDIGVDRAKRVWLIEVNTKPSLTLFPSRPKHPMNRRIQQLSRLNNRRNS